jgi:hypothetical protein
MSSITWWNRLEPRPHSADPARALQARIRDPAWILARQWQFGEFRGEDAASPAFVSVTATRARFLGWREPGGSIEPLAAGAPLETQSTAEALSPDLGLRVELGQTLETLFTTHGATAAVSQAFRAAYPFSALTAEPALGADPEHARFLRVCEGRALDGYLVYAALLNAAPTYPAPVPTLTGAEAAAARNALDDFKTWIEDLYGAIGTADAPSWNSHRLGYEIEVAATSPDGAVTVLSADPNRDTAFDWYAFDERGSPSDSIPAGTLTTMNTSVLPIHVRFRGMPNHRFWDFEPGQVNFGAVDCDLRDLARMMVTEFLLMQGNDWFVLPLELSVGTLCRVEALVVRDVFGGDTAIHRADRAAPVGAERWTMFSTTVIGSPNGFADYFLMPPSATASAETSEPIEEVQLMRDQMANMAWAIEHETENGVGLARPGHEREIASRPATAPSPAPGDEPPLRWHIQTPVPAHWIPLVPTATTAGGIALAPGSVVRASSGGAPEAPLPFGRIVKPGVPVDEAEVLRSGTRIRRMIYMTRWIDGSAHLWVARRKSAGAGEGSSGLKFDQAEVRGAPP